jgi:hypothetical protein
MTRLRVTGRCGDTRTCHLFFRIVLCLPSTVVISSNFNLMRKQHNEEIYLSLYPPCLVLPRV